MLVSFSILAIRSAVKLNILIYQGPPLSRRTPRSENTPHRGHPALEYTPPPSKQEPPEGNHTSPRAPGSPIHCVLTPGALVRGGRGVSESRVPSTRCRFEPRAALHIDFLLFFSIFFNITADLIQHIGF